MPFVYETPTRKRSSPITSPPPTPYPKEWTVSTFEVCDDILVPLLSNTAELKRKGPMLQPRKRSLQKSKAADDENCAPSLSEQEEKQEKISPSSPKSVLFCTIEMKPMTHNDNDDSNHRLRKYPRLF